jgi:hypothetical protein
VPNRAGAAWPGVRVALAAAADGGKDADTDADGNIDDPEAPPSPDTADDSGPAGGEPPTYVITPATARTAATATAGHTYLRCTARRYRKT